MPSGFLVIQVRSGESVQRKAYVKTYGCQMNVYDSERMQSILVEQGYQQTDSPESADLILLNTCHIREKAAEKVYSDLGRYRSMLQARGPRGQEAIVGVAGEMMLPDAFG